MNSAVPCELNASVLFLGQKYQTDFYGEEYFLQAASKVLECLKGAAVPNYTELWKKLTRVVEMPEGGEEFCSLPEDIVNNWDAITDAARQALQRNASEAWCASTGRFVAAGAS